jgi:ATP-dependent DNA helicase RecG
VRRAAVQHQPAKPRAVQRLKSLFDVLYKFSHRVTGYSYTHLKMKTDTDYVERFDGYDALPLALLRLSERIMIDNPITTIEQGLFHFEYRTYPEIAIREALMNAFCHADYRISSPILVKSFPGKLAISNPGGFIGGGAPGNILHHPPVSRNPHLVDVLTRLRLVNRSNLGVPRMFSALLIEGKEPPAIEELGETVKLTFIAGEFNLGFRTLVATQSKRGNVLAPDHLLILQYLSRHPEIDTATAARICQRSDMETRETLSLMERDMGFLERGGSGRGTYWTLNPEVYAALSITGHPDRSRRIDWESAKTRVLSILKQRASKKNRDYRMRRYGR